MPRSSAPNGGPLLRLFSVSEGLRQVGIKTIAGGSHSATGKRRSTLVAARAKGAESLTAGNASNRDQS